MSKELIHLINKDNTFVTETGIMIPCYESDDVDIEVPDTADVEVITEGILERINNIKEKMKETLFSMKNSIANFYKSYLTVMGRWKRRLNDINKEKFTAHIDEDAFEQCKLKTYRLEDMKKLIKVINDDMRDPLPQVSGHEFVWKHFPKILPLLGYQIDIFYKDAYYLGQKIEGLKEINIVTKKNDNEKIVKKKLTFEEMGWSWNNAKSMYQTIMSFLDIIKHTKTQCDKVLKVGYDFVNSIQEDYMYRQTTASIETKKSEIIYNNATDYLILFYSIKRKVVQACMDIVSSYYSILKKAKAVQE